MPHSCRHNKLLAPPKPDSHQLTKKPSKQPVPEKQSCKVPELSPILELPTGEKTTEAQLVDNQENVLSAPPLFLDQQATTLEDSHRSEVEPPMNDGEKQPSIAAFSQQIQKQDGHLQFPVIDGGESSSMDASMQGAAHRSAMEEGRWESPVATGGKETLIISQIPSKVQLNSISLIVERVTESMLPNQSNQDFQISNEINLHDTATNPSTNDQFSAKSAEIPSNPAFQDLVTNAPAIPQAFPCQFHVIPINSEDLSPEYSSAKSSNGKIKS
ncbi:OLC1v1025295C1 [Oldenlandia corymbosa var. corymbosa]|uniref:OLC1v1025295C1 n=1 Tax=Oldenlandia corymbosa var. corymbosa TaxID=529605 RepID=A0AAV1C5V0_OLDCO|nr:OLC1v1025295C1 [Oldenlandia corymbosa var. corymbosa]